ncbi:GIY-YIG nuclease family protein [Dictyobacter halimunensis]|uniref:GIY-YIG nuclease family protein n=1 Tax=Dictyobacter halimunensis TaxID=3026934 RepID=UPI0030C73748
MNSALHYVYIVRCVDGTLYTGYATDVARRVATHNAGKGARYTRARLPVELLASWEFATKNEALRIEYALKRWPRRQKLLLIETPALITLLTTPQPDGVE